MQTNGIARIFPAWGSAVRFTANGKILVTVNGPIINLWRVTTGALLASYDTVATNLNQPQHDHPVLPRAKPAQPVNGARSSSSARGVRNVQRADLEIRAPKARSRATPSLLSALSFATLAAT